MQSNSSAKLVDHALCYCTSMLNHFCAGCRIHEDVDVLTSIIFILMALSNLILARHTWIFLNVCKMSFFNPFNKNVMIIFTQHFFALLLHWLYIAHWYVIFQLVQQLPVPSLRVLCSISLFLTTIKKGTACNISIKLEGRLNGGTFERGKFPTYQLSLHTSFRSLPKCASSLQRNKDPHGKEHLLNTWSRNQCDF
jgi:hypothetical protein